MSIRPSIRFAGFVPLALTGILVTACGSTGATTLGSGGGSQAASGGSSSGSSSGTGVLDGVGHPVNICSLLPVATVASVTGEPLTVAKEQDTVSYKIYMCDYTSADGTAGLTVSVLAMDAAAGFQGDVDANKAVGGADPFTPISGLGDKAFSAISGVEALFGNVSITVSNLQSTSASETLIRDLQPKL
ncbi:MAG TPA: DUF3558 family protein [Candidatus Saccharimonadales bacterium]|nr:DUF3558 family protein [Candidatus Saccharimonadales bacterium]